MLCPGGSPTPSGTAPGECVPKTTKGRRLFDGSISQHPARSSLAGLSALLDKRMPQRDSPSARRYLFHGHHRHITKRPTQRRTPKPTVSCHYLKTSGVCEAQPQCAWKWTSPGSTSHALRAVTNAVFAIYHIQRPTRLVLQRTLPHSRIRALARSFPC